MMQLDMDYLAMLHSVETHILKQSKKSLQTCNIDARWFLNAFVQVLQA